MKILVRIIIAILLAIFLVLLCARSVHAEERKGYSELEIAKKREALENVLIPCSLEENRSMLQSAGFVEIEPFFQFLILAGN